MESEPEPLRPAGATPATYAIATWLCLRLLGVCLLANFASLLPQVPGLVGSAGINPLAAAMAARTADFDLTRLPAVPSLFWLSTADWFLVAVTWAGLLAGVAVTLGCATRAACVLAYVINVSFHAVEPAQFGWFNWPFDDLLTETCFLAVFLCPGGFWSSPTQLRCAPRWARWLALWLLFRLFFGTGFTKLVNGGAWSDFSALHSFLVTQMFPSPLAPWLQELPHAVLRTLAAIALAIELLAPWLFWWSGRPARWAASAAIALMIGILAAGSFRGFNLLSIGLLALCFDDDTLRRWLPRAVAARVRVLPSERRSRWPGALVGALVSALVVTASLGPLTQQLTGKPASELPAAGVSAALQPFHLATNYFMFCWLPPERLGLVVQGTHDGEHWLDYQPHHLPAAVDRPLHWCAPATDHLGFCLWLAAYGPPEAAADWLPQLLERLRSGEPAVRALFAGAPFGDTPPSQVRAALYRYRFAPAAERAHGICWQRDLLAVHTTTR